MTSICKHIGLLLLLSLKVKSESEVTQSVQLFVTPMDCSLPGSSAHGIFQARVLEWVAISVSRISNTIHQLQNHQENRFSSSTVHVVKQWIVLKLLV